ncbi:MAG: hypothetical protein CSB02_00530 [Bacteroidia bacterium]|nr:MAG: hypothetical protein CSB02_00530 [Bacteroidia bacterium]
MENNVNNAPAAGKNGKLIWILLFVAALLVAGYFIWRHQSVNGEYQALKAEKEQMRQEMEKEINDLMYEHQQIKTEYGQLSDSLFIKDSLIQANAKEIKQLLNYKWEYRKVKRKLDQLRVVARNYVHQMDSLYTVNHELVEENKEIKVKYNAEKAKNTDLKQATAVLQEKIDNNSVLTAYGAVAKAYHLKNNGKERLTTKARRTDIIEVCFTLSKNALLKPGAKDVYVRIARPDRQILTPGIAQEYVFDYQGEKIQYSILETIQYDNEAVNVCLRWQKKHDKIDMLKGNYMITVFSDGKEIGHTNITLR